VRQNDNALGFTLAGDAARAYLSALATTIDRPAKNATVTITNGRVAAFTPSENGRALDIERTLATLDELVQTIGSTTIPLTVAPLTPAVTTQDANDLGIVEQIGAGRSNFAGSPGNRRKNVANGARALHGLLIPPGTEFSLVAALGNIDAANGYFQELVIKGNRTIPEYGGGLCQIGTTMFRTAMDTGLPITERQNHSYSVRYYFENGKPGTDATIYGPHPDLRFTNDTGGTILIQTTLVGDDLRFELWGKKDGRVASRTEPRASIVPNVHICATFSVPYFERT
jgi:vancomycin resistance protein YoaR